jgi:hypothetical protein
MKWKPTDVTISILFIYRRISTCFGPTGPSSGEVTQRFTQPLVPGITIKVTMYYNTGQFSCKITKYNKLQSSTFIYNSCVNSPEDGPVGPKHVEIRRYMNEIEIVTSVVFHFICWKDARYKRLQIVLCFVSCFLLFLNGQWAFVYVYHV